MAMAKQQRFCTCRWSVVHSTDIDPPHIVKINPDCPHHGHEAPPEPDPDAEYERMRDDEAFFNLDYLDNGD
jgi:hypothetical protein